MAMTTVATAVTVSMTCWPVLCTLCHNFMFVNLYIDLFMNSVLCKVCHEAQLSISSPCSVSRTQLRLFACSHQYQGLVSRLLTSANVSVCKTYGTVNLAYLTAIMTASFFRLVISGTIGEYKSERHNASKVAKYTENIRIHFSKQ